MNEEEELLEVGRPTLPRPARIAGAALIVAALVTVFAVRLWPDSNVKGHQAALGSAPPAPTESVAPNSLPPAPVGWPTAAAGCGGETEVSMVSSRPPAERTGLRMLLGGDQLRIVDFDTGAVTPLPNTALGHDAFVATLTASTPVFGTTMTCGGSARPRIVSVAADGTMQYLGDLRPTQSILADGDRAWTATAPNTGLPFIKPLAQGPRVQLPANTYPVAIENGTVVGSRQSDSSGSGPALAELLLIDAHTGRVEKTRTGIGSQVVGVGAGRVLWTSGCDPTADRPCRLDLFRLTGVETAHYPLPRPALTGIVSPDGTHAALLLEADKKRQTADHPFPPSNVAVLNLRTGRLDVVPGVTLPAKAFPGLAFSANGRWLGIALDAGTSTRMLAWRPGLRHPYEMTPVRGSNYGSPPLVSLPARTG